MEVKRHSSYFTLKMNINEKQDLVGNSQKIGVFWVLVLFVLLVRFASAAVNPMTYHLAAE